MIIAGLDYSITSPGLCVNEVHHFWHKDPFSLSNFIGHQYPIYKIETERVYKLAADIAKIVKGADLVIIEDYSFGASGRITAIAEGLGLVKGELYAQGIPFKTMAPATLKKFATGSGRAKKPEMVNQFIENTDQNLYNIFDINPKRKTIPAPITDIADAYFLYKYGEQLNDENHRSQAQ